MNRAFVPRLSGERLRGTPARCARVRPASRNARYLDHTGLSPCRRQCPLGSINPIRQAVGEWPLFAHSRHGAMSFVDVGRSLLMAVGCQQTQCCRTTAGRLHSSCSPARCV